MGQVLHGRARTTEEIRREIQNSQESLKVLAKRYGINEKTVLKWRHRKSVHDAPMGPKNPHSTVLTPEEEAACSFPATNPIALGRLSLCLAGRNSPFDQIQLASLLPAPRHQPVAQASSKAR